MGTDIDGCAEVWDGKAFRVAERCILGNPRSYRTFAMLGGRGTVEVEPIRVRDPESGEVLRSPDLLEFQPRCILLSDLLSYLTEVVGEHTCVVSGYCPVANYLEAKQRGQEPEIWLGGRDLAVPTVDEAHLTDSTGAVNVLLHRTRRIADCSFLPQLVAVLGEVGSKYGAKPEYVRYLFSFL